MSGVFWFSLSLAITVLGLMASWAAVRKRGVASGMRGAAWSLVPLAAYLTGVTKFLTDLVFSPVKWAGVVLVGVGVVFYVVSGVMLRKGSEGAEEAGGAPAEVSSPGRGKGRPAVEKPSKAAKAPADTTMDADMAEIERILRGRGIN
jgi:hypothetical protein